jgi:hypothetical protein
MGGAATNGQGNAGGNGGAWGWGGGGGGGAGAAGANAAGNDAGKGGDGVTNAISGQSVWYAGGGGGGTFYNNGGAGLAAAGGLGGGGAGQKNAAGSPGTPNKGGGGGGGAQGASSPHNGGNGGSGVVIVRYALPLWFVSTGVSNVAFTGAEAHTTLEGTNADVYLVWDTSDKGNSLSAWGATNMLGAVSPGPIGGAMITGLSKGTSYTCRFFATNAASGATAWSAPVAFLTDGPVAAAGGDDTYDIPGYRVHVYTNVGSGTFNVTAAGHVEALVVGGGGGGGYEVGGGGGAGGFINSHAYPIAVGSHTVTVGAGGSGGTSANGLPAGSGSNSVFASLTAIGGGGGGNYKTSVPGTNGATGGSGGGGSGYTYPGSPGSGTPGQGNDGGPLGSPAGTALTGSGGGGAGGIGGTGVQGVTNYAAGGVGVTNAISGVPEVYATGGKGGGNTWTGATAGAANTGNGGDGQGNGTAGCNGGSGIVIVRYEIPLWLISTGVSNVTPMAAEAYTTFGGTNADVYLVWDGTDRGLTLAAWGATNALGLRSPGPIDGAAITGLTTGAYYTCRFFATNAVDGTIAWSEPVPFRASGPPLIATLPESGVTHTSAVLNGSVISTGNVPTTVRVHWGTTDRYPNYDGWLGTHDFGAMGEGPLDTTASSLAYNTAYVYRYYATNAYGEAWGDAEPFTTPFPPAQTLTFNHPDGDWHTAAHWSPTQVPIEVDTAYINSSRIATIASGSNAVAAVVYVGRNSGQNGTLNVNGSLSTAGDVAIAYSPNSTRSQGTVNQGAGSVVAIGGHLVVGQDNSGTGNGGRYTVADGGALALLGSASDLRIAYGSTALGAFTYSNATAALSVPGSVTVGYSGNTSYRSAGIFNQGDNTAVNVGSNLTVGGYCATGAAYNQGTNTAVTVGGNLTVGNGYNDGGLGVLYTVPETGTLALTGTAANVYIAYGRNGRGTFTYNSTTAPLTIAGNVTVGYSTHSDTPATGSLIQGPDSAVTIGGSLTVGSYWSHAGSGGVYTVGEGASLALAGAASDLLIAYGRNGRGTFICNGPLTVVRNVTVAYSDDASYRAAGTFTQADNTAVTVGGNLTIGGYCAVSTAYTQGTNTSVSVGGDLTVGNGYNDSALGVLYTVPETGTLALTGTAANVHIAYGRNGRGTFTYNSTTAPLTIAGNVTVGYSTHSDTPATGSLIQGPDSAVTIRGSLTVGSYWSHAGSGGAYTVGEGASLTLAGAASDLLIAYGRNGRGTFTCNGPLAVARNVTIGYSTHTDTDATGSLLLETGSAVTIGGSLTVGDYCTQAGNGGVCSVTNGAMLTVAGATTIANAIYSIGRLNVHGGTVNLTDALTLGGSGGNRDGRLNLNGGALHLPRATSINTGGSFANAAGSLHVGIGGDPASGNYDKVTVSGGTLTLGGRLQVDLEGGYTPLPEDSYTIVTRTSGTLSGVFANAPDSGRSYRLGGFEAVVTYDANSVVLSEFREAPDGFLLMVR